MERILADHNLPHVIIYTDGGCNPNPGPGGWGAVLLLEGQPNRELSGGAPQTTNNRMELQAAIAALQSLPEPHRVDLYTDSQYLRRGVTQWLPNWQANHWRLSGRGQVKNRDLWEPLARELERHQVSWHWTRGHAGNQWNERADELASKAIPTHALPLDDEHHVHIFLGAAYLGREKRGGWAALLRYGEHTKSLSGSEAKTSANRMHIRAAIQGLQALKRPAPIHIYTTSDYLKNGATAWCANWAAGGWVTRDGKPVSHRDLWEHLMELTRRLHLSWHVLSREEMPDEMKQAKKLASQAARGLTDEGDPEA